MTVSTTVENCESEPIHVPESVQPHGVLFELQGPQLQVMRVSESCNVHLDRPTTALIGQPIGACVTPATLTRIEAAIADTPPLRVSDFRAEFLDVATVFCGLVHHNAQGRIIFEIEPDPAEAPLSYEALQRTVQDLLSQFHQTEGIEDLAAAITLHVRALTQFDRVMVYRFDPKGNGQIIAEQTAPDLVSYLGWRYPAADIPAQARRLYEKNWVRCISNARYEPSPVLPAQAEPLDMSFATLRSVSPVHRQYMLNMGSVATMSVSLLNADGSLWGLIACHHQAPLLISYRVRVACSFLGQILSWQLQARTRTEAQAAENALQRRLTAVLDAMAGGTDRTAALAAAMTEVAGLFESTGACLIAGTRIVSRGALPDSRVLMALRDHARQEGTDGIFATDCISRLDPEWTAVSDTAAGLLAIELDGAWLFWIRPQQIRSLSWGGNPHLEKIVSDFDGVDRLSPRGSFDLWRETVKHLAEPWSTAEVQIARDFLRILKDLTARRANELTRLTNELQAASASKDEFLAVVSHELRTPINAISGWVKLLRSGRLNPTQTAHALDVIERNTNAQVQIISDLLDISRAINGRLKLDLIEVDPLTQIEQAVDSLRPMAKSAQVRLQVALDPRAGPILADPDRVQQIVFNLLSNGIKFTPKGGRVRVTLRRVASMIEIAVADNGVGFAAEEHAALFSTFEQGQAGRGQRSGLGLGLSIVRRLVELHGGSIEAASEGHGMGATFTVRLPIAPVSSSAPEPQDAPQGHAFDQLSGVRALIVEDEPDSRSMLRMLLQVNGLQVVDCADAMSALEMLEMGLKVDLIISDIGLPEISGHTFLKTLRTRPPSQGGDLPAVALTAYARAQDRTRAYQSGFQAHIAKPVEPDELFAVLATLLKRRRGQK